MKKSKIFYICGFSAIFCAVTVIAANSVNNEAKAATTVKWGHYNYVAETYDTNGCREYWCNCGTGEISFIKPTGTNVQILSAQTLTSTKINQIATYNDYRVIPKYNAGTNYIYYGEYPKSVAPASMSNILNNLISLDGYKYYNGNKYIGITTQLHKEEKNLGVYKYEDGSNVTSNVTRYFKIEPIKWRVLSSVGNYRTLLSEYIIDARAYNPINTSDNHYNNSNSVRTYLNSDFYNTAFPSTNRLQINTVDNSAATTMSTSNTYACQSTSDKVYLLSCSEVHSTTYGFITALSECAARATTVTDYSLGKKGYMNATTRKGAWLTRSPGFSDPTHMVYVNENGVLNNGYVTDYYQGIRPVIQINIA